MSAIFAAVGGEPLSAAALQRAVVEMASRGAERMDCRVGENAGLAAGRFEWEVEATSPGPLVVDDGVRVVVHGWIALLSRRAASRHRRRERESAVRARWRVAGSSPARRLSRLGRRLRAPSRGRFRLRASGIATRRCSSARAISSARALSSTDAIASASSWLPWPPPSRVAANMRGALDLGAIGESLSGAFNLGEDTAYLGVAVVPVGPHARRGARRQDHASAALGGAVHGGRRARAPSRRERKSCALSSPTPSTSGWRIVAPPRSG